MTIRLVLNPGSGPVADATLAHAQANMEAFIAELREQEPDATFDRPTDIVDYSNGRWGFYLRGQGRVIDVQMPGIPLEQVRFLENAGMDAWQFPRLYIDHGSWLWCFALTDAVRVLRGSNDRTCLCCDIRFPLGTGGERNGWTLCHICYGGGCDPANDKQGRTCPAYTPETD